MLNLLNRRKQNKKKCQWTETRHQHISKGICAHQCVFSTSGTLHIKLHVVSLIYNMKWMLFFCKTKRAAPLSFFPGINQRCPWAEPETSVILNFKWSDHFVSTVVSLKGRKQGPLNSSTVIMLRSWWEEQCVILQSHITGQRANEQLNATEKQCLVHCCSIALSNGAALIGGEWSFTWIMQGEREWGSFFFCDREMARCDHYRGQHRTGFLYMCMHDTCNMHVYVSV